MKKPNKVIVRNSYYTFSREYPAGQLSTFRSHRHRRNGARRAGRVLLFVLLFCVVFAASFFAVDLALKISGRPIEAQAPSADAAESGDDLPTLLTDGSELQALCLEPQTIRDRDSVKASIRQLKKRNCNSVILDFKTQDGRLLSPRCLPAAVCSVTKRSATPSSSIRTRPSMCLRASFALKTR